MPYVPKILTLSLVMATTVLALSGCASTRPIPYSGIASSPQLRPNLGNNAGHIPYDYSAGTDWKNYSSAIVDPVEIYTGQDGQFEKISEENKRVLAQYMEETFRERLRTRFNIVSDASRNTLRVKITLTGAKTTTAIAGTVTKFDLAGGPYNVVQSIRGKEGALNGSVSYAIEIYDATTDRLLSAYVEKQYPNALNVGASFGALGASKAGIRKGADELIARLD